MNAVAKLGTNKVLLDIWQEPTDRDLLTLQKVEQWHYREYFKTSAKLCERS